MSVKPKILLVEDELTLATLVQENLEHKGYEVTYASNGEQALKHFFAYEPDLVILDVMMPKANGFQVAKTIRNTDRKTPIIFLTAKIKPADVVQGFEAGGNDYLRKPFAMEELLVRMRALLNTERLAEIPSTTEQVIFKLGQYSFNAKRCTLAAADASIRKLTTREAELLKLLCENRNQLLTKASILLKVWGDDSFFNSRSMDVFISRLRKYLADDATLSIINLRGVGYKLVTD
jgi:DNA-binding response OmpR family regulator